MNRRLFMTRARYACYGALFASLVGTAAFFASTADAPTNDWGTVVGARNSVQDEKPVNLQVAQSCRIAKFGQFPWLPPGQLPSDEWARETQAALGAMGLPPEAAAEVTRRAQLGKFDGVLGMGDTHGIDTRTGAFYYPSFTTTYRKAGRPYVCLDTMTTFHTLARKEHAILYHVPDATGKIWHIAEFGACGNISLVTMAPPGWLPPELRGPGASGEGSGPLVVPEPGTLALTLLALLVIVLKLWKS